MRMRRKPWTEVELAACPFMIERPSEHIGRWQELFPRRQPVYLEIGCGKGVATVRMAHEHPEINYIAIDEVRHVLAVSVRNTHAAYGSDPVDNLVYSAVDAMLIHDTFDPSDEIARIYISFPNPWDERAKHHKRRLTHPRQLMQYQSFLKPGGEIWFKTDDAPLFEASKRYFDEAGFDVIYSTEDLHGEGFEPNYVSEHEQLYIDLGKPIRFCIARCRPASDRSAIGLDAAARRFADHFGAQPNDRREEGIRRHSMMSFFDENREALENFARISNAIGDRPDYVQGGGGNTSVKLGGGLMAIKASGYCLKDVRPDSAYAVLDSAALRRFYFDTDPSSLDEVEKAGGAEATRNVRAIDGLAQLRPSVEADFHSILDRYVAHSHSVYVNLCTCSNDLESIAGKALDGADYGWTWVPYADPGAGLTFSIRDALRREEAESGRRPEVILLKNHGLIVHSDDPVACLRIHGDVNDRMAKAFGLENGCFPAVKLCEREDGLLEADCPYLTAQLASGRFTERFLLEEPLYPDQLVFLGGSLAFGSGRPDPGLTMIDLERGTVTFNMAPGKAQVLAETLTSIAFIVRHIEEAGLELSTLGEAARAFIANWESEKYRKSLAGK